jgi:hypothetical protein
MHSARYHLNTLAFRVVKGISPATDEKIKGRPRVFKI